MTDLFTALFPYTLVSSNALAISMSDHHQTLPNLTTFRMLPILPLVACLSR